MEGGVEEKESTINGKAGVVTDIKVKVGTPISYGKLLAVIALEGTQSSHAFKLKAKSSGKISRILIEKGQKIKEGEAVFKFISGCSHPTVMKDMCAECGADLRKDLDSVGGRAEIGNVSRGGIAMVHSIPELKVSSGEAQSLGQEDEKRLLKHRKLVLLVDLDQTVIHTTNENIAPNMKDVYHFQLYGPHSPWYHTRIRPRTTEFLESISKYYELHICTFGARMYAHTIAGFLDPNSKYFSHRILSRDESFNNRSKTANLSALFPCGDHMVCIIDDREDVWNYARNLVHVKPYHFFKNTGDINAPPGSNDSSPEKLKSDSSQSKDNKCEKNNGTEKTEMTLERRDSIDMPTLDDTDKTGEETLERRDSIDMPTLDDVEAEKSDEKAEVLPKDSTTSTKEIDAISLVSDDLELSDESSSSSSEGKSNGDRNDEDAKKETKENKNKKKKKKDVLKKRLEDRDKEISDLDSEDDDQEDVDGNDAKKVEDDLIEIEDHDDYLLYLEEILKTIHKAYYDLYDQMSTEEGENKVPDLKTVIPYVKRKALQGTSIVFSSVIPTHVKLEQSKPYMVARSLGAKVTDKLENPGTTHLVAAKLGTAKVNESRKIKGLHIVTPDWLWCCAERWERCDERLFPLSKSGPPATLKPPAHCSSPEIAFAERCGDFDGAVNTPSPDSDLPETMNPYLAFSSEDLEGMDKEIDDILSAEDSSSSSSSSSEEGKESNEDSKKEQKKRKSQSDDEKEEWNEDRTKCWKKLKKRKRDDEEDNDDDDGYERFKSGQSLPRDFEVEKQSDDEDDEEEAVGEEEQDEDEDVDEEDDDGEDEGGWNTMAKELEREFLGDCNSLSNL